MTLMHFMDLLIFSFIVFGFANGVAHSRLLEPVRFWALYKFTGDYSEGKKVYTKRKFSLPGELIHCVWCMSFWAGGILGCYWVSPTGDFILDCLFGSAAGWMLFLLINKRQSEL